MLIIIFLNFRYHFFRPGCLFQPNNSISSYFFPPSLNFILLLAFDKTLYIPFIILSFDIHFIFKTLVYSISLLLSNLFVYLLLLMIEIYLYSIYQFLKVIVQTKIRLTETIKKFSRLLILSFFPQIQSISFVLWPILSIVSKFLRLFTACLIELKLIFKIQSIFLLHYFISISYYVVYLFDIVLYTLTFGTFKQLSSLESILTEVINVSIHHGLIEIVGKGTNIKLLREGSIGQGYYWSFSVLFGRYQISDLLLQVAELLRKTCSLKSYLIINIPDFVGLGSVFALALYYLLFTGRKSQEVKKLSFWLFLKFTKVNLLDCSEKFFDFR